MGIEWQINIIGLIKYRHDIQFEVDYTDFTNDKQQAEKMIVLSLANSVKYLAETANIRNAMDLIPTFDNNKIIDVRDKIIQYLKKL